LPHAFEGGIAVGDVVVRKRAALQLLRRADAGALRIRDAVERGRLVRVLAVAQVDALLEMQVQRLRKVTGTLVDACEVAGDSGVVACRVRKCLRGETL